MRRFLYLVLTCLFLLAGCSNDTQAAKAEKADQFKLLLQRLPPGADLVVLMDGTRLSQIFREVMDDLEKTPVVAENSELAAILKGQRAMLEQEIKSQKDVMGFDPIEDVGLAAIGLWLLPDRDPDFAMAASGKFPKDLPSRIRSEFSKRTIGKQEVYEMGDEMGMAVTEDGLLIAAKLDAFEALLEAKGLDDQMKNRHPDILGSFDKGFLFRFSASFPEFVRALGDQQVPGASMLQGLAHVDIDIGENLRVKVKTVTDRAAENVGYMAEGIREFMVGGRNLFRAYIYFALSMDLGQLPDFPPPIRAALANKKAILATMEQYLGEMPAKPTVKIAGRTITLTAPKQAMVGNAFVVGVLAAVAIPAFVGYTRQAEAAEAEMHQHMLQQQQELEAHDSGAEPGR